MKNIRYTLILFFTLALHSFTFGMGKKEDSITLSNGNGMVLATVIVADTFFGGKGSWFRSTATILGVGCALGLDEAKTERSGKNCTDFQTFAVLALAGVHVCRAASYISNTFNELDKKVMVVQKENQALRSIVEQMISQKNQ